MSTQRDHFFGVDFSGSSSPATDIWITEGRRQGSMLQIDNCRSAADWFNIPRSIARDTVYDELRTLVKSHPSAVFGFDFPFSLPEPLIDDVTTWEKHLERFTQRFGNTDADGFRKRCVGRAAAKPNTSGYLRRETDWRHAGQCPYHNHISYQTLHGQRDFLAPAIDHDEVRALPMQTQDSTLPWLIEVYPASTLGRLGLYRHGYKNSINASKRRARNIEDLRTKNISIGSGIKRACEENDDAHDSLIAAIAVANAIENDFPANSHAPDFEGQIFA